MQQKFVSITHYSIVAQNSATINQAILITRKKWRVFELLMCQKSVQIVTIHGHIDAKNIPNYDKHYLFSFTVALDLLSIY